jgi:hypothetical protein
LKAATLAREGQQIFMAAVFAFRTGKTVMYPKGGKPTVKPITIFIAPKQ